MRNNKRKGFTLVELLIVIVVIGVLSTMMMLSSTEAVTSARASNIVSNLRNFKTAALAMYVDYLDSMDNGKLPATNAHEILVKYMNKSGASNNVDNTANYHLVLKNQQWYVYVTSVNDARVQEKLAGRAQSVGLLSTTDTASTYSTSATDKTKVYMFVTSCDAEATATADTGSNT